MVRPIIAIVIADAAIETAMCAVRLLTVSDIQKHAKILVVGDNRAIAQGEEATGCHLECQVIDDIKDIRDDEAVYKLKSTTQYSSNPLSGGPDEDLSASALSSLKSALDLAGKGEVGAIISLSAEIGEDRTRALMPDGDLAWIAEMTGMKEDFHEGRLVEVDLADGIWLTRVTGMSSLEEALGSLSKERLKSVCKSVFKLLRNAGLQNPNIALGSVNPALNSSWLGREERVFIKPAIENLAEEKISVAGPFSLYDLLNIGERRQADAIIPIFEEHYRHIRSLLKLDRSLQLIAGLPVPYIRPRGIGSFGIDQFGDQKHLENVLAAFRMAELLLNSESYKFRFRGDGRFRPRLQENNSGSTEN